MSPRQLSVRKGSTTALDPHGFHSEINMNPSRSSSSTLTIVRVSAPNDPQRRTHRRIGQNSSPPSEPSSRVSFAFSSFSSNPSTNKDQPPSPSSSPRIRPSSPLNTRSGSFSGKLRLTPDQLVDLARQATNPKTLAQPIDQGPPGDHGISHSVTPATFTPLPDDIYLPFIDRPSEVAALISSPPDLKLFSLLAQTFPNKRPIITDASIELPPDPRQWNYYHLIHHLTHIDRDIAPDPIWAIAARKCIHFHSELIWERVKGALGVPPELDIDYDFVHEDGQSTSNADEDLDRGGHWADWDSVMDSPVQAKRLSFESPVVNDEHDPPFIPTDDIHDQPTAGGATRPTLDRRSHFSSQPTITHQEATPLDGVGPDYLSIEPLLAVAPSSAPTSFNSLSNHPPPLSIPSSIATAGDGLGDIAEGAEEDETELVSNTESTVTSGPIAGHGAGKGADDAYLISPNQIQGLKISTSPIPNSNSYGTPPMMLSPISPLPPYPPTGTTVGLPQPGPSDFTSSLPHSRTSSFSSIGPFQRSESTGGLAASWSAVASGGYYASSVFTGSEAGDTRERDGGYVSDGDRLPGQPLFPSNFARLAMGPTFRANDPALKSINIPLRARYFSGSSGASPVSPSGVDGQGKARAYSDAGVRVKGSGVETKRQSWGADG
ncbi:hypothetical protein BYT27DRAFT_6811918 [Phlegmacium glaucopus]|nr:hypothetical protein BYT27DRAFT_6811918 [Phlegmacium glaucopus]